MGGYTRKESQHRSIGESLDTSPQYPEWTRFKNYGGPGLALQKGARQSPLQAPLVHEALQHHNQSLSDPRQIRPPSVASVHGASGSQAGVSKAHSVSTLHMATN